jgi:lysophospholipase L1-like esterase
MPIRTSHRSIWSTLIVAALTTVALVAASAPAAAALPTGRGQDPWVGSWSTSPQPPTTLTAEGISAQGFNRQTLRLVVHPHLSGSPLRLRLSNAFGRNTLTLGPVYVGVRQLGAAVLPGTNRVVTFGGNRTVLIAAGAEVLSDPVALAVRAEQDLVISVYAPGQTGPATWHWDARQTNYIAAGNHAAEMGGGAFTTMVTSWFFLDGVDVRATARTRAVVTLGNSITDGAASTIDANRRWPDFLARRLLALPTAKQESVLNEGISGNRVLHDSPCFGVNAQARLDRDVLAQHGVRTVILMEGINDIGFSEVNSSNVPPGISLECFMPNTDVSAAQIIFGYQQIIARVHAKGLRILGGTLTPFQGAFYYTATGEAKRQAVNTWVRTSGAFDGVVDFDRALRDPANPLRLLPAYDSGDHLHPSDAGYAAMANAVNLHLLQSAEPAAA